MVVISVGLALAPWGVLPWAIGVLAVTAVDGQRRALDGPPHQHSEHIPARTTGAAPLALSRTVDLNKSGVLSGLTITFSQEST